MDQLTVHTPGLDVFVLTLRLFKLDCLTTSTTSGSDRLCAARVPNFLRAPPSCRCCAAGRNDFPGTVKGQWEMKNSSCWLTFYLMTSFSSFQTLRTDGQLGQKQCRRSTTVSHCRWVMKNKVEKFITGYSFPSHNNKTAATFLQGQRICSHLQI